MGQCISLDVNKKQKQQKKATLIWPLGTLLHTTFSYWTKWQIKSKFNSTHNSWTSPQVTLKCLAIYKWTLLFPLTTRATFSQTPPLQREPVHNKTQALSSYPPPQPHMLPSPACPIFTQWQGSHTVRGDRRGPVRGWLTAVPERMLRDDGWPSRYVMS